VVSAGLVFAASAALGCQPLYGNKPEKLRNPDRKKKPEEPPEQAAQIKYVEDCVTSFRDDPKNARPDASAAARLVDDGNNAIALSARQQQPAAQADLVKQGLERYRSALVKDPFNQEAHLRLAVAYDMVYRKGCALALLKRIPQFEANPKYRSAAKRIADEVADNPQLFKGYRKDAVQAVGR
jgi:thioredoxin-like negative regulator of GroEL